MKNSFMNLDLQVSINTELRQLAEKKGLKRPKIPLLCSLGLHRRTPVFLPHHVGNGRFIVYDENGPNIVSYYFCSRNGCGRRMD